jgi:outer membrane receptor protein involved in Fe transport
MTFHSRFVCKFACLLLCGLAMVARPGPAVASELRGQVVFGGLPVPGATVHVTQGAKKFVAVTDRQGFYTLTELTDGAATIEVDMLCFVPIKQDVTVAAGTEPAKWEMKLLSIEQIRADLKPGLSPTISLPPAAAPTKTAAAKDAPAVEAPPPPPSEDLSQRAADGLLINGSSNNAATSAYSLAQAFGNHRNGTKSLYNGGLSFIIDNSVLDARPFSITGQNTPKATYNRMTAGFTFGGPIKIPHLIRNGPNFFMAYEWTRNSIATAQPALVPDAAERIGDLSGKTNSAGQLLQIINPATGQPFAGNIIPVGAQAQSLLNLYPLPNFAGGSRYNYQVPILSSTHQDSLQTRLDKNIGRRDAIYGRFAFQSSRIGNSNIFGFADKTYSIGINSSINWSHRYNSHWSTILGYQFSRLSANVTPFWADRSNLSGQAGITGNNQDATNWGPPTLNFVNIARLSDVQSSFNRSRTDGLSASAIWNHTKHNVTVGLDFRRQSYNDLFQQDPRGTFTFTGAATQGTAAGSGSDFADFLLGIPDTSSIAFGNADKYLRQSVYDAYVADDWRVTPTFTANVGLRWEYGAPITELKGRLVNLDIAQGFAAATPVLAGAPTGALSGQVYPSSLMRPDKRSWEPRIGISWRPIAGSSMVVRAGYGIYSDTSAYQATTLKMAQQAPLSKSLSVQNSAGCPLTLANGFNACGTTTANTFAVDPNLRVGYAQTWQLAVQRDLPFALQITATYLGIKGTRGVQQFLPNSYPIGGVNPCPACPLGFVYRTSNGNSTREAGQLQLRRRLRSGFTASALYVYSKSIDSDAQLGGQGASAATSTADATASAVTAQNWRDLRAERELSSFDQRHTVTLQVQYTSGMGSGGGSLMSGSRGTLLKEWTMLTAITAGTGLPETPTLPAAVPGTGVTGTIRGNYTGASIYTAPAGLFLNPAAFAVPAAGQWGNTRRNSITGPGQFNLNASAARTFRLKTRYSLDLRIDATNLLNRVVYTSWNTTVGSTQFGLPMQANAMRSLQTTLRLRF